MPIEIRELIIKVKVEENSDRRSEMQVDISSIKKQVIKECMSQLKHEIGKKVQR